MEQERDKKGKFKSTGLPPKKRVRTEYNRKYHKEVLMVGERHKKRNEGARKSYKKHKKARIKYSTDWQKNNREKSNAIKMKSQLKATLRLYSLSENDFHAMFLSQNGCCAICNEPQGERRLSIDHDHKTGRVRGLLCDLCNRGLGHFKDNVEFLLKASEYLK